ncbi:TonB-dependent receptor [Mucilaginibacter sp. Bleaf8]|uniref:TonB-dependent receptor n=1 Tax=Mucilaginibacter sp. Bleaf8 TaxID=2834430 RepID=UPI001BCD097A|nr:carboxypeptidase regulatory-like domain-containing protein [Mucilaginibacter sp. Bleaf8]MBS7562895.1 TonB-dependent receptor [Mucilaginibacter sp. Bleaf8]
MRKNLLLVMLFLFSTAVTFAQVTTSSITGTLKDAKGDVLIGATVRATHQPSGTNYATTTNADGRYTIPNMRTGGPYVVTITYVGYEPKSIPNISLSLGQSFVLNEVMSQTGTALSDVVIKGTAASRLLNSNRQGSSTNISTREIATLPTITRNINDLTRLTPQASSTSNGAIGGGNYRQNAITVDGSNFSNRFGIGSNLPANGAPISLDALSEISVNVTPYDVKQGGFIGSAVNAVTRSGTNNIEGSVYTYWRSDNQQGNKVGDATFIKQKLQQNQTGFRIGGPIIKNKLFLFVNGEFMRQTSPGQQFTASSATNPFTVGNNQNVKRPTETQLNDISNFLRTKYGYETGPYQGYDFKSKNNKFLARLDWNINDNNKFNIRYSQVESSAPSFVSTSRSPLGDFAQSRTSQYALNFANSNYYQDQNLYSLSAEWNSNFNLFNTKLANTLRVTYDHQNDPRSSDSQVFPFVDILQAEGNSPNYPLTSFGYEPFTYGNLRDVKTTTVYDYVTWIKGIHNFTAGLQAEFSKTKNGFQRFGTGYYTFASWDDFANGANPTEFAITYPLNEGFKQAYPSFKFAQYSAYFQDDISLSDRFRVSPGLRLDLPTFPGVDEIRTHDLVNTLAFNGGYNVNTGVLPKTRVMFSPRIGFNYDVNGDRSLQIRGGTGIFTGQIPFVWIVSQSGDSGLLQFTQTYSGANVPGPFNPDPTAYRPTTLPKAGTTIPSAISAMDPNLKFPQVWGSNLAVDVKLPFGMIGTLEGMYKKDINNVYGTNVNLVNPQTMNVSGYPDHRDLYPSSNANKFVNPLVGGLPVANGTTGGGAFNAIVLTNGNPGHYYNVTAKLDKPFSNGLSVSLAYSRSGAKNIYDGSGDQLINTWSGTQVVNNPNNPPLSYASYVVPNRVIASIQYRKEYLKHLATTVSMFYEGSITGRFSYTYSQDFNRDGQRNDLIYVPKDASEITFSPVTATNGTVIYTAQQQSDAFFAYIAQDNYLSKRMGKYAERNGAQYPWRNQFDFKFLQDLFVNVGGKRNTIQFSFDVFNVGNLLNSKWGKYKLINNNSILVPTNVSSLGTTGTVKPTFNLATDRGSLITNTFRDDVSLNSTYFMQFGLRYIFN